MKTVRLFTFVRDEAYLMRTWIPYHGDLFGFHNLHIIDHSSTDDSSAVYEKYLPAGLQVHRTRAPFSQKCLVLTEVMRSRREGADLLVSLDGDEFLCLDDNGRVSVDRSAIHTEIERLPAEPFKYRIGYFDALNHCFGYDDPLLEMVWFSYHPVTGAEPDPNHLITCFDAHQFAAADDSNSYGEVRRLDRRFHNSRLMVLHFEIRGYDHFIRKNLRGAKVFGFDVGATEKRGTHYKRRFAAIRAGEARQAFLRDFYRPRDGFKSRAFADRIRQLDRG